MSPEDEYVLLSETLDALDRLYDHVSSEVDTRGLLRVALTSLRDSPHEQAYSEAERALGEVIRSGPADKSERNRAAVLATNTLRSAVAEAWGILDVKLGRH